MADDDRWQDNSAEVHARSTPKLTKSRTIDQLRLNRDSVKNTITFKFVGSDELTDSQKDADKRRALEELHQELIEKRRDPGPSRKAMSDLSDIELQNRVTGLLKQQAGTEVSWRIVIVRIDPKDPTGSYLRQMDKLDRFLSESRKRFLGDAIMHLGTLDPTNIGDRDRLCNALVKAKADEFLDDSHKAALEDLLKNKPELNRTFQDAETRYDPTAFSQPGHQNTALGKDTLARQELLNARQASRTSHCR